MPTFITTTPNQSIAPVLALFLSLAAGGCAPEEDFEADLEETLDEVDETQIDEIDEVALDGNALLTATSFPGLTDPTILCTGTINDGYGIMRYCRNRSIYSDNTNVRKAIILIHGSNSNARTQYYDPTILAAQSEGVNLSETDIIAIQFFQPKSNPTAAEQAIYDQWEDDGYYLWPSGWRWGYPSSTDPGRSSFDVVDHIIGQLMDHRPNLDNIVVAGQSAGGQFVDRYSVFNNASTPGVGVRYWVANPGSYFWHTSARPDSTAGCSTYNNYHRGFANRGSYPYVASKSSAWVTDNALDRDIFWTSGELDTGDNGNPNCGDLAQGNSRNDRWENHRQHINDVCLADGRSSWFCLFHTARHIEIPGAEHGYADSLASAEGREILFD
ncbi:MAG: hypothetical protein KC431_02520 [Myxococcales bacterium]|nr:hypothetical protein [Myxococcales bacterium]